MSTLDKSIKANDKSGEQKILMAEKNLREKEKIAVQMEMRAEEDKTNGI